MGRTRKSQGNCRNWYMLTPYTSKGCPLFFNISLTLRVYLWMGDSCHGFASCCRADVCVTGHPINTGLPLCLGKLESSPSLQDCVASLGDSRLDRCGDSASWSKEQPLLSFFKKYILYTIDHLWLTVRKTDVGLLFLFWKLGTSTCIS